MAKDRKHRSATTVEQRAARIVHKSRVARLDEREARQELREARVLAGARS